MRAASSSEPSHHTICSGRVIRATDSTHCSSGVDTKPPKEIVSAYRRGTQGIKSLRIASGSAETANLKSLRHACGERKMHALPGCHRETSCVIQVKVFQCSTQCYTYQLYFVAKCMPAGSKSKLLLAASDGYARSICWIASRCAISRARPSLMTLFRLEKAR